MLKKIFSSDAGRYGIIAGLIGAVMFFLLFGYKPLIVTNVAFLYDSKDRVLAMSDTPYHQFGLDYFLRSPWSFPPGNNPDYPYPYGSSILISDSLPLFAFIAKIFAGILPDYFQYFGIWTLLCFILQGTCAALVMRRLGVKMLHAMCAVPLFVINVPLLFRCFHHCALCGQWLILLAVLGYLYNDGSTVKKKCIFWTVLCVLSVLIQGYFLVMCGAIMTAAFINDVIHDRKKIIGDSFVFVTALISSVFTYFLCGGFLEDTELSGIMFGQFSFDLSFLLDPYVFSSFFSGERKADLNTEHDAYLGVGLILLYLISMAVLLLKRKELIEYIKKNSAKKIIMALVCICFFVVSLSPQIKFFGKTVVDLMPVIPEKILAYMSIFRSSARFFWPVWYIMLLCSVRILSGAFKDRSTAVLGLIFVICAVIQLFELPALTIETRADEIVKGYPSSLENAFGDCFNEKAKHVSVVTNLLGNMEDANVFAVHHGLTVNRANLGRGKGMSVDEDIEKLVNGQADHETIYLLRLVEADDIPIKWLPEEFVLYYDNEKYMCFFDRALLKSEPDCQKLELNE